MFFYVVVEILLSDVNELYVNSFLEVMICNLFLGVNGVINIFFDCNEGFLEYYDLEIILFLLRNSLNI